MGRTVRSFARRAGAVLAAALAWSGARARTGLQHFRRADRRDQHCHDGGGGHSTDRTPGPDTACVLVDGPQGSAIGGLRTSRPSLPALSRPLRHFRHQQDRTSFFQILGNFTDESTATRKDEVFFVDLTSIIGVGAEHPEGPGDGHDRGR